MARVRNWGELDWANDEYLDYTFSTELNDEEFCNSEIVQMILHLDKPITIEPKTREEIVEKFEFEKADSFLYSFSALDHETCFSLKNGRIMNRGEYSFLFPTQILKAFEGRESFSWVILYLNNEKRFFFEDTNRLYDVMIAFEVSEKIQFPDKLLRSFARKLSEWLNGNKEQA